MTEAEARAKIATLEGELVRIEQASGFADRTVTYKRNEQTMSALAYYKDRLREIVGRRKQSFAVASKGF